MQFFKKDIKLTEVDAENIVSKTLAQLKKTLQNSNDDIFVMSSGKGVITLSYIKRHVSETLKGDGRVTINSVADSIDVKRDIVSAEILKLISSTPYDLYLQGETVFTTGEIDKITHNLGEKIENEKYVTLVDFGSSQRIDQTLLKRVVERLNTQTHENPKTIILENFVLSEPALESAKTQLYDTLNRSEKPVQISSVEIDDDLFRNEGIRAIIVKSVPKAVKAGQLQGKIEKGDTFVPEATIRQAQKTYIDGLKANGIVAIEQIKKVGVKDVDAFLEENLEVGTYIVLTDNIILTSYVERLAAEVSDIFTKDNVVEISNVTLFGVGQETPDRNDVIQMYLEKVYENFPDTKFSTVYTKEVSKKARKTTPPNYIVNKAHEKQLLEDLKNKFVTSTAEAEALKTVAKENYKELIIYEDEGQLALPTTQISRLDERFVTTYLQKQYGTTMPLALLRYYASADLLELRETYEKTFLAHVQKLYNSYKLEDLVLLLLHLTAVLDIEKTSTDLAETIYKDFRKNATYGYILSNIEPGLTLIDIKDQVCAEIKYANSDLTTNDIAVKLTDRKQKVVSSLLQVLSSTSELATVFQIVVAVYHSRQSEGILDLTAKESQKVFKLFKTSWQLTDLDEFIKSIKEKREDPELVNRVKALVL